MKEITEKRYAKLLCSELKLELLENYGVDNWSGYDEIWEEYDDDVKKLKEQYPDLKEFL